MVTNCSFYMSEWSRTTIIELINSTGRLTSSGLSNWFHLFAIVNIYYINSIIVKIFSINTSRTSCLHPTIDGHHLSMTVTTRQMFFIWTYKDCWRKMFLVNCHNSMMNSLDDDKQITNINWWTLTYRHRTLLFFCIQLRHTDDDCQWLLLIEGGGERERKRVREREREKTKGTLVASHRSQWWWWWSSSSSSISYLSTIKKKNLIGVSSLSHTSWLYLKHVVKRWIRTKRLKE